jgi:hypothetical protein
MLRQVLQQFAECFRALQHRAPEQSVNLRKALPKIRAFNIFGMDI